MTSVEIDITATDSKDTYLRYWDLFVDQAPGSYQGGGLYSNTPAVSEGHYSGDSMSTSIDLDPGSHTLYLVVTQTGGSGFGTYSGSISVAGKSQQFSGVAYNAPYKFSVNVPSDSTQPPTSTGGGGTGTGKVGDFLSEYGIWIAVAVAIIVLVAVVLYRRGVL